ncbi:putative speedy protein-like protein 3 [Sapajus apella]|uniref:Speedy protein-like protein 3 n=1 Tax=Sapajus apella TaxID=9515 RepID=A0A6J3HGT6_SAPAP|nr:putative speedy protein-like protein 3 [Sapajus apella]
MARCQLQPQLDERSLQPSTSGYSLLEVIDDEVPGPSGSKVINCRHINYTVACFLYSVPWVDPGTPSKFLCWNRKREWSDQSEEPPKEEAEKERAPEPEETWVLDTLCGLKMKLKRQRVSPVLPEHYKTFNTLLAPWVDPSTPNILCCKRKREWSDESEEPPKEEAEKERAPEPEETCVLDTLCGLKMKLKRRRVSPALPKNYEAFNTLLVGELSMWEDSEDSKHLS